MLSAIFFNTEFEIISAGLLLLFASTLCAASCFAPTPYSLCILTATSFVVVGTSCQTPFPSNFSKHHRQFVAFFLLVYISHRKPPIEYLISNQVYVFSRKLFSSLNSLVFVWQCFWNIIHFSKNLDSIILNYVWISMSFEVILHSY